LIPPHTIDGRAGAPVVVLANSLGTSSAMWSAQVEPLRRHRRVVCYEHRGHGGSPASAGPYSVADFGRDVIDLLDHLEIERASVCGVSLGGMVAMWLGARRPERVDRLVLACTAAHLPPAESWYERAATVRAQGTSVLLPALLARWFSPGFLAGRPEVGADVAAMLAACDPEGYAGCCEAIATMDQRGLLAAIEAPTLVLAGRNDPVTPPATAFHLHEAIAESALSVIPGAAHLANIEQADRVNAVLLDHLLRP
jgi:3-oxoadipate enol-lactonase